jgi:hypothetical protein
MILSRDFAPSWPAFGTKTNEVALGGSLVPQWLRDNPGRDTYRLRKLLQLRNWLAIPDAARHLSILFGGDVSEADGCGLPWMDG